MTDEIATPIGDILRAPVAQETVEAPEPTVSLEAPVVQPVAAEAPQQEMTPVPEKPKDEPPPGFMPYGAYRDEKQKRQELEERTRQMEAEIAQFRRMQAEIAQQQAQPAPDMFQDPEGYTKSVYSEIQRVQHELQMHQAMTVAAMHHGFDKVREAEQFVMERAHSDPALAARVVGAPNRWEEAIKIHQEHKLREEIGSDPAAYRAKIEAELLAKHGLTGAPSAPPQQQAALPSNFATTKGGSGRQEPPYQSPSLSDILKR